MNTQNRAARITAAHPSLSPLEASEVIHTANDIANHARRHWNELAEINAAAPSSIGPPVDPPPAPRDGGKLRTSHKIYNIMAAKDLKWWSIQELANLMSMKYQQIKYSVSQLDRRGYLDYGPSLARPGGAGGSTIKQFRLKRKTTTD